MTLQDRLTLTADWFVGNAPGIIGAIGVLVAGWFLSRLASRAIRRLLPWPMASTRILGPCCRRRPATASSSSPWSPRSTWWAAPTVRFWPCWGGGPGDCPGAAGHDRQYRGGHHADLAQTHRHRGIHPGRWRAGGVVEIGLFGTRLRSSSGLYVFTPNQKLWASAITNHSREPRRRHRRQCRRAGYRRYRPGPPRPAVHCRGRPARARHAGAQCHVDSFSGSSINMQLRAWVATPDYLATLYA